MRMTRSELSWLPGWTAGFVAVLIDGVEHSRHPSGQRVRHIAGESATGGPKSKIEYEFYPRKLRRYALIARSK